MIDLLKKINFSKIEVLEIREGLICKVSKEQTKLKTKSINNYLSNLKFLNECLNF